MVAHLLCRDQSLSQQELDVTVISGALNYRAAANVIDATVAYMRPPGRLLLNQAYSTRRPRPVLERQMRTEPDDFFMSTAQREMQKTDRIEDRVRGVGECFDHDLLRDLGSARAFGVTAHPIDGQQQRSMLSDDGDRFVLVIVPGTEKTDVGVVDLQGSARALLDWARFISRPAVPSA